MLCSGCQRPLPESLVCEHCVVEDDELTLAPLQEDAGPLVDVSDTSLESESLEVHLEPEEDVVAVSCRKCRALIPSGRLQCPECGYNPQLSRPFDPLELDEYEGALGFHRFLMKHTSQNDPSNLILWLRIFGLFVIAVYIVTSRDLGAILISGMMVGGYLVYLKTLGKTERFHAGQSVIPRVILLFNRLSGWSGIAVTPKARGAVITYRGGSYSDENLAAIEDTLAVEVLDIPGTAISDTGILYLQNFPNLKALVVHGCTVSETTLDDLQRSNRAVMIWR